MNDHDKKMLELLLDGLQDAQHFVSKVEGIPSLVDLWRGYVVKRDEARRACIDFVDSISKPISTERSAGEGTAWGLPEKFSPMTLEQEQDAQFEDYLDEPASYKCNGVY